ncbi:MAG: RNA methyltransferase [Brevundimonas sp.]|uniref:class I SAM-dependent RNA methyltransferase n=1 Tax=Brevundimonas sp. TaxID=1871086 RepID=UPI000DB08D97|nr:class I SAM-dependent RNA methyltransferase [Brevundimonas sp.]PZT99891.1 MAG: RNA methyltransferase [Brevundimonas sp.]
METFTIDRVGGQGDGVARTPSGPVFASLTLPGETVRGQVVDGRLEGVEIVVPSPDRIAPVSPQYGDCGGCSLQHWAERPYLGWKREQVRLALARERIETEVEATVATPPGGRRRVALHARRNADGRVVLGFKARRSWRLVAVTACPVADPRIVQAIPALTQVAAAFFEHPKSAPTLHVTWTLAGLDVDVTGVERRSGGGLSADARTQAVQAAYRADLARLSLAGETLVMARQPTVAFGPATVALPAGGFLQAAPQAEAAMTARAVAAVKGARKIADLFCGAGTFTFPLATVAPVIAADASKAGIDALRSVGSAKGMKAITAEARDLFRRPMTPYDLKGCDAIVFDPPRAGAVEQTAQIAATKAAVVVGVSCNPQTFARDARVLIDAGFRLETVTPIDQFLWSAHVELVGVFRR